MLQLLEELFQGLSPEGTPDPLAPEGDSEGQGA